MSRVRTHPQLRPRVICAPSLSRALNSGGKLPELLAGDREGGARLEGPQLAIPLSFQRSEDAVADETHTISTSKRRACGLGYRCGPVDTSEEEMADFVITEEVGDFVIGEGVAVRRRKAEPGHHFQTPIRSMPGGMAIVLACKESKQRLPGDAVWLLVRIEHRYPEPRCELGRGVDRLDQPVQSGLRRRVPTRRRGEILLRLGDLRRTAGLPRRSPAT